ncbi:hypothetical protein KKB18_00075 [bacterium]|nr:hypothetical protein [bacterium]
MDKEIFIVLIAIGIMLIGSLCVFFMSLLKKNARKRGWTALLFMIVPLALIITVCSNILITGEAVSGELKMFKMYSLNASLHFGIDRLSAFFMILVMILAIPVVMFSIAYMEKEKELFGYYTPLILFIVGMLGVLIVDDFFFFFIPWEFMSLSAYALILFEKKEPQALKAGIKYFIVTHFGNICLILGVIIIYFSVPPDYPGFQASFSFSSISRAMGILMEISPIILNLSLTLIFIGFMTKAGAFPFGFWWLPDAHPAAPSPVSSLLSGVMIKIGIYGLIRSFMFLLPYGSYTIGWGWAIAIIGTLSLFFGTLRAMMQHDSKILLAYHSIGQIGYILLALGTGMIFMAKAPFIALTAFIAGLYHLMNHTCFKGLLFLNAGSVIHKAGMRDMDKLGGMAKLLPFTSIASLIAVLSIGGLPGFNGFVSKWMIYQSTIFAGMKLPVIMLMSIIAIFISVVTIVSVLKFYGTIFLGHIPETFCKIEKGESLLIVIPQLFLAFLCILLGIIPALGIIPGFTVFSDLPIFKALNYNIFFQHLNILKVVLHAESPDGNLLKIGLWNPFLTIITLIILCFVGYFITRSLKAPVRTVDNWYCGSVVKSDEVIYRSSSYYLYIKEYFDLINKSFLPTKFNLKTDFSKVFNVDEWLFLPFCHGLVKFSKWFARSHVGIPQIYLLWTVVGALITFVVLFWIS